MPDLNISLSDEEFEALKELSEVERRPIDMQAAIVIRRELERCELVTSHMGSKRKKIAALTEKLDSINDDMKRTKESYNILKNTLSEYMRELEKDMSATGEIREKINQARANANILLAKGMCGIPFDEGDHA